MVSQRQVYLIQSNGNPAKHLIVDYEDRTYADELIKHFYYRNESWDKAPSEAAFGDAKPGDYVLQYCTGNVDTYPRQIRFIYEVVGHEGIETDVDLALQAGKIDKELATRLKQFPHVIRLKLHRRLNRGLELSLMKGWCTEGRLSVGMKRCGQLGFNIRTVEMLDYEAIIEWDKNQPPEPVLTSGAPLEEDLRNYLAQKRSLSPLGGRYRNYTLYEDDAGNTGEEYDTGAVGEIDLLYRHVTRGDFLVVELKRTEDTPDKAAGQIARYIGWVQDNLADGKKVRGLLIVRSASEDLRYAVKAFRNCRLASFELKFDFKLAD